MQTNPPVACTLNGEAMRERQRRWQALAARAFVERVETGRGLRLVFHSEPGVEAELHELAALERDCCAFADWTVGVAGDAVALEVSAYGDEGAAAVKAMFRTLTPAATRRP
jgi:hypothetical protein